MENEMKMRRQDMEPRIEEKKQGEVRRELSATYKQLTDLECLLTDLFKDLEPITREECPTEKIGKEEKTVQTNIGSSIREINCKIENLCTISKSVLERLEL